jgi:hypothetical protein
LGKKTPTDTIYRAAILTARDIDSASEPSRAAAAVSLAATLERHGVRLAPVGGKSAAKPAAGILEVEGGEGIVVSVPGDDRTADWTTVSRQNRWRLAHLVNFAPQALSIKTVAV